ncbi:MAG: hypothetical protein Q4D51_09740 [Eubacteriales bacterium]|nr:hypothetical protein [Eubacteriales bacterium]
MKNFQWMKASIAVLTLCLCFVFSMQVQAASCDCGVGTTNHNGSHDVRYIPNSADATQHVQVCIDCVMLGHKDTCASVIISKGKHVYDGGVCGFCGAKEAACAHKNVAYKVLYDYSPLKHQKYCADCKENLGEPQTCSYVDWKYDSDFSNTHRGYCVCGNSISGECKKEADVVKTKWVKYDNNQHIKYYYCKCGRKYDKSEYAKHSFSKGKCKKCGFKTITPGTTKITSFKQVGKMKLRKVHLPVRWNSSTHKYDPAIDRYDYSTKLIIKYKKAKNADHYIVSTCPYKNNKAGKEANKNYHFMYEQKGTTFNETTGFGFYTVTVKPKKISKLTVYVTPVSKTGTMGKSVKKTIKLKY